jgi:hypothetical protein
MSKGVNTDLLEQAYELLEEIIEQPEMLDRVEQINQAIHSNDLELLRELLAQ